MPPCAKMVATMQVVVVLPCVPATAMPYFMRISSASISARGITGISRRVRFEYLRVVVAHGGGDDDDIGIAEIFGTVAIGDFPPSSDRRRSFPIRADRSRKHGSRD